MFKDGFILNYYPGAKGDFLLRFIANLAPTIGSFGKTSHTSFFSSLRKKEYEIDILYRLVDDFSNRFNDIYLPYVLSQNKLWPYISHNLHQLTIENLQKVMDRYENIYDIIVEEVYHKEVSVNCYFKNAHGLLSDSTISLIRK